MFSQYCSVSDKDFFNDEINECKVCLEEFFFFKKSSFFICKNRYVYSIINLQDKKDKVFMDIQTFSIL